jgi:outer membrane protein TolC
MVARLSTNIRPGQTLYHYLVGFNASWELDPFGTKLRSNKKAAVARFTGTLEGKNAIQNIINC